MNKSEYVLVYDSGIGGLTTLSEMMKLCPHLNFLYFADTQNCPYGNKCKSELKRIISENIYKLTNQYNITHIVLACNTATTSAIGYLRQNFNIPIIGTEPNVKAPSMLGYKDIMLLATPVTIHAEKLITLEHTLKRMPHNIGIKKLAKAIEDYELYNNNKNLMLIKKIINNTLKNIPKTTAIVLGCTHYIYIKTMIEDKGYICFDGNIGVAKRLKSLSPNKSDTSKGKIHIITGNTITNYKYRKILNTLINKTKYNSK